VKTLASARPRSSFLKVTVSVQMVGLAGRPDPHQNQLLLHAY
jgi:hypothetical protein